MPNAKHIFIQVDTEKIAAFYQAKLNHKVSSEEALGSTLIFEQGSMVMGDPIKNFNISIEKGEDVRFTVLPCFLFSRNILYFTGIEFNSGYMIIEEGLPKPDPHICILLKTSDLNFEDLCSGIHFDLNVRMEYLHPNGSIEEIDFTIDPVLKVKQR